MSKKITLNQFLDFVNDADNGDYYYGQIGEEAGQKIVNALNAFFAEQTFYPPAGANIAQLDKDGNLMGYGEAEKG